MSQRFWNTLHVPRHFVRFLTAGLLLCATTVSGAQQLGRFDEGPEEEIEKPWQELALQLPPAPQAADLADFYLGPTATSTSSIDLKSLMVGDDGIIRFTIVTKTRGGAINISYEGIRCATGEKKLYAFGRPDGSWSRSRQEAWRRIVDVGANRQDAALYKDYFCQNRQPAGNAARIIDRLRNQRPIEASKH